MNCAALIKRQFNSLFVFCFSQRYQFVRGDEVIDPYRLFADLCVWHNYICNSINIFAAERHTGRSLPTVDKLQKGVKTHSSPESLFDNCALAAITVGNDLCVVPQCTSWHGTVTDRSLRIIINLCVIHAFSPSAVGATLCGRLFLDNSVILPIVRRGRALLCPFLDNSVILPTGRRGCPFWAIP